MDAPPVLRSEMCRESPSPIDSRCGSRAVLRQNSVGLRASHGGSSLRDANAAAAADAFNQCQPPANPGSSTGIGMSTLHVSAHAESTGT